MSYILKAHQLHTGSQNSNPNPSIVLWFRLFAFFMAITVSRRCTHQQHAIMRMNLLLLSVGSIIASTITGTVAGVTEPSSSDGSIGDKNSNNDFDGCTEIFVGGGWAGVYSFYRRVMMDSSDGVGDASNKCLFEASWRIGGRTYSVPINRTDGSTAVAGEDDTVHFVQDVGAYRFSPGRFCIGLVS